MCLNPSLCSLIDGWDKFSFPYTKKEFGKWELILPPKHDKSPAVDHNTRLKVENRTSSYLFSLLSRCRLAAAVRGLVIVIYEGDSLLCVVSYEPSENLACRRQQHVILTVHRRQITVCTQSAQWMVDAPEEPN